MKKRLRGEFLDPREILLQSDISMGDAVADFGCSAGFFTFPAARIVGERGVVYAFDILPEALQAIRSQSSLFGITNVVPVRVDLEKKNATKLDEESVDIVVLKDLLFQNEKKGKIITEVFRVLKPGGQAIVVEWQDSFRTAVGPRTEDRVPPKKIEKLFSKGFHVDKHVDAGNYHYALIFKKVVE
jgi:ubiquinone/menaquinone biosynthesis C-methylase UbiE